MTGEWGEKNVASKVRIAMIEKKQAAVAIPVYKERLTRTEEISLSQAIKKLDKYDFYYICPSALTLEYQSDKIKIMRFPDEWFGSLRSYSALMLQRELYEKFSGYEYILVYQLDSFVFSDELSEFCELGYDYIGAPWLHGVLHYVNKDNLLQRIGNGGLSLRRVSAFIHWLKTTDLSEYMDAVNEDILIAAYGKGRLRFPDLETALRFSFDLDPKGSYRENHFSLPFACHAWHRYDLEFWRPFMETEGFSLEGIVPSGDYERYQRRYQLEDERNRLIEGVLRKSVTEMERLTDGGKRELYIWGTGLWGTLITRIYDELGIAVAGYIDNNKNCDVFMGRPVQAGEAICQGTFREHVILIAVVQADEIIRQLSESGCQHGKDYMTIKDMITMDWKEEYTFWDLIAEEAYLPENEDLRAHTWERFQQKAGDCDVYLFGCNDACRTFLRMYGSRYPIAGILDNASAKWGSRFEGIEVFPPGEVLPRLALEPDRNLVVIAMRLNADKVAKQMDEMGFHHYYGLGVLLSGMEPYASFIRETEEQKKSELQDVILMESTNDFDGNAGALYEYMRTHGSEHTFVWIIKEEQNKKFLLDKKDVALCPRNSIEELKQYILYRACAKWQIWDNHPIRKVRDGQINVYLQHFGMGYKQIANIFNSPAYVDYALNTNENVYRYEKDALLYAPGTQMIFGELPRNDVLFSRQWRELEKITDRSYDKTVMWAPTLRDSALYSRVDSDISYPYGVSVLYTDEDMEELNRFLAQRDMLLLIKIHPRQKYNYKSKTYSNIHYLDGKTVKQVHAYKLLTQMDALITDYSSIVFDYMLLDRPIAWVLEDMEHYKVPFLMENPLDFMPGEKIYRLQDLFTFLEHVKCGEDPCRQERNKVATEYNAPMKGKGCETLVKILGL